MRLTMHRGMRSFAVRLDRPMHIGIPLRFDGAQPNIFSADAASARTLEGGGFVGDTRRGGSCNVDVLTLTPHCNGTHTECIGHIADERIAIHTLLEESLIPATVVTVRPVPVASAVDSRLLPDGDSDRIITASALSDALHAADPDFLDALIVRTLPNDAGKCARRYDAAPAPYFSIDAMRVIADAGVRHLLVDVPSLDRASDGGRLSAHRVFWNVPDATHDIPAAAASRGTITEMIFVSDAIADGSYLLNLHIAAFMSDASPSRPILYPIEPTESST
jgi:arylformamidase